jgi:hypothetical protein
MKRRIGDERKREREEKKNHMRGERYYIEGEEKNKKKRKRLNERVEEAPLGLSLMLS